MAYGSATEFTEWEAAEEAKAATRVSLEEVLGATEDAVLAVAGRYLRGATREEIATLAEAWEFKAERVPGVVWKLLLACWAEQDGLGALAAARRIDGEAPALEVFTVRIWEEVEPAAAVAEAEQEPKRQLARSIDVVAKAEMEVALEQGPVRDAALRGFTSGLRNNEVVASSGVGKWVEPFSINLERKMDQQEETEETENE